MQEKKELIENGRYAKNGNSSLISRLDNHEADSSSSYYSDTDNSKIRRNHVNRSRLHVLDKLSFKIGATLRRYPAARIFILLYMVSFDI